MDRTYRVAVLVGSLRKNGYSIKIARLLKELAAPQLDLQYVEIGQLPIYNQDLEMTPLPEWTAFHEVMKPMEAVLFVTPEHNRSVPAALKNAIDVGSRPYVESIWKGKPACVVSTAPYPLAGFGANHHLRQSLVWLDMPTMQQPEAYVGGLATRFDEQGNLTDETTREFLKKVIDAFATWIPRFAS